MTEVHRDAATVMLVRDVAGGGAVEVCMLRRNLASEFVAGAYVFPGGSVDPDDLSPLAEAACVGRTAADADAVLGVASGGLAVWVAALRECFEESGVLLARRRLPDGTPGELLDLSAPDTAAAFVRYRADLNGGRIGFLDICRHEDLVLDVGRVHFVSHWITPEQAPRRYDTRFFVAAAPPRQLAVHDDGETIASTWIRPDQALARGEAGEFMLMPPTVANLSTLAGFATVADVMAWAAGVTDVVTVEPIVLIEDGRVIVLRPGDPGYREAIEDRAASAAAGGA